MKYKTEQETFWASQKWGRSYVKRNPLLKVKDNLNLFSEIISKTNDVKSIVELGSNIGINLIALNKILPNAELSAIEINKEACQKLKKLKFVKKIYNKSILNIKTNIKKDLVLIKGVLIHINPNFLSRVYQQLYNLSKKYIIIGEYYNRTPVTINYRGHSEKLFKRDFAGELLDKYKDLELVDYGFRYHRDNNFPMDDITWFLLKKKC